MGGIVDAVFGGGDTPQAPNYQPVADASKEAAEIGAKLGREQLAEAKRQYDNNIAVSKQVVDAQLDVMRQGIKQGDDYYEYGKSFRPLEQQMMGEAARGTEAVNDAERKAIADRAISDSQRLQDRANEYEARARADIDLATGGNAAIAHRYKADIDADVGTAVADARTGQTQALNTALRQAMRYGLTVPTNAQAVSNQNAAQLAAAANNTRTNSINNYRGLVAQGVGLNRDTFATGQAAATDAANMATQARSANRNMRIQDQSLDWAKKLDVTGMARGMPGASQGAYGVAVGSGNSAAQNQMAPGQALVGAMGQSTNTTMQGRQIAMQGLTSNLNAQTSAYNTGVNAQAEGTGALFGAASTAAALSDRRLKENISEVGRDDATGLTLYEFEYKGGDGSRFVGVMADEVEKVRPDAVNTREDGYKEVDYGALGLEMPQVGKE